MMDKTPINKSINYRVLVASAVAALIAFLVFIPALKNGFVNWDDPIYFI